MFFGVFFDLHFYEYSNSLPLKLSLNYIKEGSKYALIDKIFNEKDLFTYDLK